MNKVVLSLILIISLFSIYLCINNNQPEVAIYSDYLKNNKYDGEQQKLQSTDCDFEYINDGLQGATFKYQANQIKKRLFQCGNIFQNVLVFKTNQDMREYQGHYLNYDTRYNEQPVTLFSSNKNVYQERQKFIKYAKDLSFSCWGGMGDRVLANYKKIKRAFPDYNVSSIHFKNSYKYDFSDGFEGVVYFESYDCWNTHYQLFILH